MMRALFTASTGMSAQQLNMDTLAHNMSNVNTVGFKKQRVEFQDLLYQTIRRPATNEDQVYKRYPKREPKKIKTLAKKWTTLPDQSPIIESAEINVGGS
ncbi:MAG: flagellar basal body protein, partial [Syntrophomonadaceae bacterium]